MKEFYTDNEIEQFEDGVLSELYKFKDFIKGMNIDARIKQTLLTHVAEHIVNVTYIGEDIRTEK